MKLRATARASALFLVVSMALSIGAAANGTSHEDGVSSGPLAPSVDPTGDPSSVAKSADEIRSFIAAWTEPLLNQSGWLHIREEIGQEGLALGLLPDGRPIPANYILDAWCLTGEDGLVTEAVVEMYDLAGERVQASVFADHEWTNVTFQITFPGEAWRPSLDHGMSESIANRADGRISGFARSQSSQSGRPIVEISTFEAFTDAITLEGYPLDVERIDNRAVFDARSHGLASFETTYRSEDGLEKTVSRVLVLAVERIDEPPDAILSLLREVSQ